LGAASAGEPVSFRIHDHRDPVEVDEVTRVYIDGEHVGTFRLGPEREDAMITVTVPAADTHRYALCGRVTIRREDGSTVTREVNGAGVLSDVAGRDYDAVAAGDFTIFYLRDITVGRPPAPVSSEPRRGCQPNVASR
jgi:hypothetical protein